MINLNLEHETYQSQLLPLCSHTPHTLSDRGEVEMEAEGAPCRCEGVIALSAQ